MNELWVDKYKPITLNDISLTDNTKNIIQTFINKKTINNLLFYGKPGCGKSTLANIIANELHVSTLYINCSHDNSIDMVRTKIIEFCNSMFEDGKIIILSEADSLTNSGNSNAQKALREVIENSSKDTRFILTCNYINQILSPIQSRCIPINITFSLESICKRLLFILKQENIKINTDVFKLFIEQVVKKNFPDIRKIIGILELWCINKELIPINTDTNNYDSIINFIISNNDYRNIREYLLTNEQLFEGDYIKLSQELFNKVDNISSKLIISDSLYRMQIVIDKEIEFTSMIIKLKQKE